MAPRIYITGSAGAGKTTLARRLGEQLGVPSFDLDLPGAREAVDGVDAWVVEGVYVWQVDQFLTRADVVVWLDLPMRVTAPRIVWRHLTSSVRRRNRHRGLGKLLRFLWGQRAYFTRPARQPTGPTDWDAISRAAQSSAMAPYADRVVHLRTPGQVRRWRKAFLPAVAADADSAGELEQHWSTDR